MLRKSRLSQKMCFAQNFYKFQTFCYAQPTFHVFHVPEDFYIVHDHINAFFLFLLPKDFGNI